jgi:CPW-WPC domain-containing protein
MACRIYIQLLAGVAVLCSSATAATVAIDWTAHSPMISRVATASAMRGDVLSFAWSGTKPVVQVLTRTEFDACDDSFGISKTGIKSPSLVTVPTGTPDGTVLYFINNKETTGLFAMETSGVTKCESEGMKIAITVSGGAGGDAGQCVALACRTTGPTKALALDASCCSIAASNGYTASCAEGFMHYQGGQASSSGEWSGETCDSPKTGTCCVPHRTPGHGAYVGSLREVLEWDSNKRPRLGCVRDLNAVCPESWKYLGKGRGCQCPETYNGICGFVSDFSGAEWTAAKKLVWSSNCLAEWPCSPPPAGATLPGASGSNSASATAAPAMAAAFLAAVAMAVSQ